MGSTIPGKFLLEAIVFFGLITNSAWALYFSREKKYKYFYQKIGMRLCGEAGFDIYIIYRLFLAVALIFGSIPLRSDILCWVGFCVIAIYLVFFFSFVNSVV